MNPGLTDKALPEHLQRLENELAESARAIAALKESEDRYLRILEITREEFLFYRHDTRGRFTYVSPSYANILGYAPEEYIGKRVEELWSNDPVNQEADRKTKLSIIGVRQPPYELEIYHKNGARRRFIVIEAPILDQGGQVVAVEGIARDITEKRRTEEQLEKYRQHLEALVQQRTLELETSKKQLHDIIDFLPDPTYVVGKDDRVIAWNRAMVAMTGIEERTALERNYRENIRDIHGASRPLLVERVLGMRLGQGGFPDDSWKADLAAAGITSQGNTLFCTRHMPHLRGGRGGHVWITTAPILDRDRHIIAAIESIRDITRIKHAEIKLQESERRLSTLMSHLPGMAYRVVRSGQGWIIEFVSEGCRQIFGYNPTDFINKKVEDIKRLIHPEDMARLTRKLQEALREGKPVHCEYRIITASDETKWVFDKAEILPGAEDEGLCLEGFMADFTVYKQMEERLKNENLLLRATIRDRYKFKDIIGNCQAMQDVYELIVKAAVSDDNVFISGASGTGKELVAQAIHKESRRKDHPFVTVNCAAIPENLIESEFFGTSKGAFTGATSEKTGHLEAAHKGTLFLDEIGDVSPGLQVKLLRAIDGGGFSPLGSRRVVRPDVRIIAASNKDLEQLVNSGKMRQDFFFRIHVIPIHLPPLRERGDDILILINHFLRLYSSKDDLTSLSRQELDILRNYQWPGNVRELQNVLKRYLTMRSLDFLKRARRTRVAAESPEAAVTGDPRETDGGVLKDAMLSYEKELLLKTLDKARWNRTRAAGMLGVSRKTLFRKMKACGLIQTR